MDNKILIVCIGNICRSPIAEGLFVEKFRGNGKNAQISSAGLSALVNYPADATSQELMLNKGFDISKHRARQLTPELVFESDIIITMTTDQTKEVEKILPGAKGRVYRIGYWGGFDVVDPYKRPKAIFEQAFALIEQGVDEWYERL
jgi:protein-tyrosine phosphatase